ncbi:hypothetical protein D9758_016160 [Tetrapyrgos nigripes]|uniref:Ornithine cyclodeaminase n=1 Tax=Tetrapyrgos nigripes TaxID=182062 RepID=A0A8H5CGI1_9AGAR|nr:hypothetical protein D9758_016160 [Tetrapyrgos nigripes]
MSPSLLVLTGAHVNRITSSFTPAYLQSLMADVFALVSSQSESNSNNPTSNPTSYMPQRIVFPTENHKVLFMPSRICDMGTTMKIVSVPTNPGDLRGLPASTIVLDQDTGGVKAIVNARMLTALRNAAGSLLSTNLIGPTHPTHIVAFGAGQQILAHLDLHLKAYPESIRSITIINRSMNQRFRDMVSTLRSRHPTSSVVQENLQCLEWTPLSSSTAPSQTETPNSRNVRQALSSASIIITATPSRIPLFPSLWVPDNAHVILIGSYTKEMKEVDRELILRAVSSESSESPRLLVDSVDACLGEAGELLDALDAGLSRNQMMEIGEVILERRRKGLGFDDYCLRQGFEGETRTSSSDASSHDFQNFNGPITLFKSVGVGLQDVAIACAVVDRAEEMRMREAEDDESPSLQSES